METNEDKTVELPSESIENIEESGTSTNNKHRNIIIGIVAAVVVVAVIAAGAFYFTTKVGMLSAQVNAEGWNKDTSTPVELAIYQGDVKDALSDDDDSNDPEAFKTVVMDANTPWGLEDITERGTYTLKVEATPVLEDGTLFKEPEPQVVTLEGEDITATFDLEKLDLEKASEEEVEEATKKAEEAAKDSGNEAAVAAASAATKKATEKAPATSHKSNSSSSSSSDKGSSSGSSSSSGGSSSSGSSQGHTHKWVDQTQYTTKPVYTEKIQCSCGATFSSVGEWTAHNKAIVADDPEAGHSYSPIKVQTGTERVPVPGTQYEKCSICGATRQGLDVVYEIYTYTTLIHIIWEG